MNSGEFSLPVIHNSVSIMTPFLLAAVGGLLTELAGILNIALEGLMLTGAFFSVIFTAATGSLALGILAGIMLTVVLSLLFGLVTLYMKANVFITGLATNLFATGLTTVLSFHIFGTKGVLTFSNLPDLPVLNIPELHGIPVIGDLLLGHNILVYLGWLSVLVSYLLIYKTPYGFRLRAAGSNPHAMQALGLNPVHYRMSAILISGLTCALAGAVLTLKIGAYVPNITAGRGWIALVVIYLGGKTPIGILGAAFVFGLAESFSNYAQGFIHIPADFILAFPYIITVIAMVLVSAFKHRKT